MSPSPRPLVRVALGGLTALVGFGMIGAGVYVGTRDGDGPGTASPASGLGVLPVVTAIPARVETALPDLPVRPLPLRVRADGPFDGGADAPVPTPPSPTPPPPEEPLPIELPVPLPALPQPLEPNPVGGLLTAVTGPVSTVVEETADEVEEPLDPVAPLLPVPEAPSLGL